MTGVVASRRSHDIAVDVVILTYKPKPDVLQRCLTSVFQGSPVGVRAVVAVNSGDPDVISIALDAIDRCCPGDAEVLELGRNWGYAGGVNRSLRSCHAPNVMLLNDDATMEKDALALLRDALESAGDDVVGVAPKVVFRRRPQMLDAVGSVVTSRAGCFNRGAGELDIGQYDDPVEIAGACFAAVLIRADAFAEANIGALWEPFFMYAEDTDWCVRARLMGRRFLSVPTSVVLHEHSASTSHESESFKEFYIDRNSWLLALRCFPLANAVAVSLARVARHGCRLFGRSRRQSMKIVLEVVRLLPTVLVERVRIRGGALRSHPLDFRLFEYAGDAGNYAVLQNGQLGPRMDKSTVRAMYLRMWERTGDPRYLTMLENLLSTDAWRLELSDEELPVDC